MNDSEFRKKNKFRLSPYTWHLVTNHQNMLYILAAGMVMGPAGFRGKHYSDSLGVFPGCVPLFRGFDKNRNYIPDAAMQQAISERKYLRPCIASFDLSKVDGPTFRLKHDGGIRAVKSTTARRLSSDIACLLPAPLPIHLLRSITFRSNEDRHVFETAAGDVANVILPDSIINVDESLFRTNPEIAWPPSKQKELISDDSHLGCHDEFPQHEQAIGGILAMLYHAANRSDLGLAVFRRVTGSADNDDTELILRSPVLKEFYAWLSNEELSDQAHDYAKIYWGVVDALIRAPSQTPQESPIDTALTYLERARSEMRDQKYKDALAQLILDMRGCLGLGGGTITELFERHRGALSRSLLLFCLRKHSRDLLEFTHPMLGDEDYVLACLLFGVRDGWIGLPRELRNPSLSDYVSCRMVVHEHRRHRSQLDFALPSSPVPLRACFSTYGRGWSEKQKEMALALADKCGWNDCIRTHITPLADDVLNVVESDSSQIKVKGRVSVTEEVDSTLFLQRLGQWPLVPLQTQNEIRRALEHKEDVSRQGE